MVMALIVEDGSQVLNSNTYCSVYEARTYAFARGITLSNIDTDIEIMLIKAMDYLESSFNYRGEQVSSDQSLQWPRTNAVVGINLILNTVIPNLLKKAQLQLVLHLNDGVDINPITTGNFVVREKIGVIETQYSETINNDLTPTLPLVEAYLSPLLSPTKTSSTTLGFLNVLRI
jgi:hypothetical protein